MPSFHLQVHAGLVGRHREGLRVAPETVKRKLEEDSDNTMDLGDMEQEQLKTAKRPCPEVQPDPEGDNGVVLNHAHLSQFLGASPPSLQADPIPTPMHHQSVEVYGCMKDLVGNISSTPPQSGSPGSHTDLPYSAPFCSPMSQSQPHQPHPNHSPMSSTHPLSHHALYSSMSSTPPHNSQPLSMSWASEMAGGWTKEVYDNMMDMDGETYSAHLGNMGNAMFAENNISPVPLTRPNRWLPPGQYPL